MSDEQFSIFDRTGGECSVRRVGWDHRRGFGPEHVRNVWRCDTHDREWSGERDGCLGPKIAKIEIETNVAPTPPRRVLESQPYVSASATSKAAAESMEEAARVLEARVLEAIRAAGAEGRTDDEIEEQLGIKKSSPRRRSLVLKGLVRDSGETRVTRAGRRATIWIVGSQEAIPGTPIGSKPATPATAELTAAAHALRDIDPVAFRSVVDWLAYLGSHGTEDSQ